MVELIDLSNLEMVDIFTFKAKEAIHGHCSVSDCFLKEALTNNSKALMYKYGWFLTHLLITV